MEEESSYNTMYPDQQQNWDFDQIQEQPTLNALTRPHSERGIAGFVSKLYQCLQSNDSGPKYVRWCRHNGKDMFVIDCIPEFTKVVLPRLFKHCKFPSFVRQLNIYGFQRDTDARKSKDTRDKESCRWYHPYFKPNRRDLLHSIRRKAIRYSRKKSAKSSIEEDPDTILTISGDDEEEEESLLHVNNNNNETSPSVSSVVQHTDSLFSSLNHENELDDALSDNETFRQENTFFSEQQENPIFSENDAAQNNFMPPDETESYNPYMDPSLIHNDPFMRIQNLELQLHQLKLKYDKTEEYFKKQLQSAHIHINQQQRQIQELEYALSVTKSVKQGTQTGGYIDTMTNSLMHGNYIPAHAPNMNQLYTQHQQPDHQYLYSQQQQQNTHVFKYM